MNYTPQHHQIALTLLSGIGSRRARIILSYFNDLDRFFNTKRIQVQHLPGVPKDLISWKQRIAALEAADSILQRLSKLNGEMVFYTDPNYPRRLRQCDDAPLVLYTKGEIQWNAPKTIAIVGTRHATNYGKWITEELVEGLAAHQCTIVSGLALGIDVHAHQAALKNGLNTWGVLGHGIERIYPHNHKAIAQKMMEQGGLITEFYPDMKLEPSHFPMRNRIVAGLTDATVVIESGASGGSLITANLAFDYHRDVFAYPGDIHKPYSQGCLQLIKNNTAKLVTSVSDICESLDWKLETHVEQPQLFPILNEQEEQVASILRARNATHIDVLSGISGVPIRELSPMLLDLEFRKVVRALPGMRFELTLKV